MRRKSPSRHRVRPHKRMGKTVKSYVRGKGTSQKHSSRHKVVGKEGSSRKTMEDYEITFYYSKDRKEVVPVAARDSDDALNLALQRRKMKHLKPIKILVVDGIGAILGTIVGKVAGGTRSAIEAFRMDYAKGASEREAAKQVREMSIAQRDALREAFAKKQLARAKAGNRAAQIWCEQHNIAWMEV